MMEDQIKSLFSEIAEHETDRPPLDPKLAHRQGRTRLRWRRARVAGTSMLAVAAVAGLAVGVGPLRLGSHPPTAVRGGAPRQFNVLDPYLSVGWLPKGVSVRNGDTRPYVVALDAGRPHAINPGWEVAAYYPGRCHLRAKTLTCLPLPKQPFTTQITATAPDVQGHRAYWATGVNLVWQYARGGWAVVRLPDGPDVKGGRTYTSEPASVRRDAVKIADNVAFGAPAPALRFPAQLTHLPSNWRVGSVFYQVEAGRTRVSSFALSTGHPNRADGGMEFQPGLPYFSFGPADLHQKFELCAEPVSQVINGYRVNVLFNGGHGNTHGIPPEPYSWSLCSDSADGLAFSIQEMANHPFIKPAELFRSHLRLLGNNPADWTTKPIQ